MSEDTVPYGNSESEITRLRMQLHHAELQRDAFKAALSKAVMVVLAEAVDAQREAQKAWDNAQAEADGGKWKKWAYAEHAEKKQAYADLANLKAEADRLKADNERLSQKVQHLETTWPRDPHHGGKIYQLPVEQPTFVNVDPLLREAIASAQLTSLPKGGAS